MKIILLTVSGFIFLGLGAIGLLLPLWPTTPFVLVSATCFSSTPKIKSRIMKVPFFREHIENYKHRTGLSKKTVCISMFWLWGMLLLSMIAVRSELVSLLLLIVGAMVTFHILWMSKCRNKEPSE